MADYLIILFSRAPIKGKVKRRLAAELGDDTALEVHRFLFRRTLETIKQTGINYKIYLSGNPGPEFNLHYTLQEGANLGERMSAAFKSELLNGTKVCLIGSDCLDLRPGDLVSAFDKLGKHDLVLGPAKDGGYFLIGMSTLIPELFDGINWGTEEVLTQTMAIVRKLELSVSLLSTRTDIDHFHDLPPNWKDL